MAATISTTGTTTSAGVGRSALIQILVTDPAYAGELLDELDPSQLRQLVLELVEELAAHIPTGSGPDQICAVATRLAAQAFGVSVENVMSRSRHRPVADARAVAQAVARNCGLTVLDVGGYFDQHHATVIYSEGKVTSTPRLAAAASQITSRIQATYVNESEQAA